MVNFQGIGSIPEPQPERTERVRSERERIANEAAGGEARNRDEVSIGEQARAAVEVARVVNASRADSDVRADRVEAARQAIERGDYRNPDLVARTAERIARLIG